MSAQSPTYDEHNPVGTDGFEFVKYTAPDPELLRTLFAWLGFPAVARHRSKNVTLHNQGDINFIINAEPNSFRRASRASTARRRARWAFASRMRRSRIAVASSWVRSRCQIRRGVI